MTRDERAEASSGCGLHGLARGSLLFFNAGACAITYMYMHYIPFLQREFTAAFTSSAGVACRCACRRTDPVPFPDYSIHTSCALTAFRQLVDPLIVLVHCC